MKALISPNEPCNAGYRVVEVCAQSFEVALPLFWIDCADEVVADVYWYDPVTQSCQLIPAPEPDPKPVGEQPASEGAQTL